jgi:3-hydroxyisobutyrate dehydrogenase
MAGTSEAMLLGTRLGLDSSLLANIINSSSGASHASQLHNPVPGALARNITPADRDFQPGLPLPQLLRSLDLTLEAARAEGIDSPMAKTAFELFGRLRDTEWAAKDVSALYAWMRSR